MNTVEKYIIEPLSKGLIKIIRRFQLFKLIMTMVFFSGFLYCFFLLDSRRCGLISRNVINAGLIFYGLDLTQHLITFNFSQEIVNKVFTSHHANKLEAFYTFKVTFVIIEIIFFGLSLGHGDDFFICPKTHEFINLYLGAYAAITLFMLTFILCCGEAALGSMHNVEDTANDLLYRTLSKGPEYIEDYLENKIEPVNRILEGKDRITRSNKSTVLKENLTQNYELLEL